MFAARVTDQNGHPGAITGPGMPNVLIGGLPAVMVGDTHACAMPTPAGPHPPTPGVKGSLTVLIGGRQVLRLTDLSGCGAPVVSGQPNVTIGG
jgi:uncharacterized Zn-binding protein involved in type VI secretion